MCGVAGSFSYDASIAVDLNALHKVSAAMQKRGPDGDGFWENDNQSIAFAHRRLAVIDLSANAAQPMQDATGRFVISFNGEIYNYLELRQQCEEKGYQFNTQSDTEVLLAMYELYQVDMLSQLRGMFAFAICDTQAQSVLLARDPHGIKPLYYVDFEKDGSAQCSFSSSLRALTQSGLIDETKNDQSAVVAFKHMGSVPEPVTWFEQATLLPAGSYRMLARGSQAIVDVNNYWNMTSCVENANNNATLKIDHQQAIRQALTESVQAHMVADVPIGLFLSAGIDSSVLAATMRECSDQSIKAITLRFSEYQDTDDDESLIAAEIAKRHGLEHHVYTLGREEFVEELPRFFAAMEQPTIDGLNTWFVAKAAKELGLKVVISGVGGDELFGGYPSFSTIPKLLAAWPWLAALFKLPFASTLFRKTLDIAGVSNHRKWSAIPEYDGSLKAAYRLQRGIFLHSELDAESKTSLRSLEQTLALEKMTVASAEARRNISILESQCYMRNQLLRDADWASMAHSIEIRTPLVDSKLSEALAMIPADFLYQKNKAALAAILPSEDYELLAQRKKTGFTLPMKKWLSDAQLGNTPQDSHWSRTYVEHVITRFSGAEQ